MKSRDLSGMVFGRLTVLYRDTEKESSIPNRKKTYWKCRCICGKLTTVRICNLKSGDTKSCGCYGRETRKKPDNHHRTHGKAYTPEYTVWACMLQRCYYSKGNSYHRYGGRGIKVCDRWRKSFTNFYADMGDRPSKKHSIDRIDNDGDYCPENCRWATGREQAENTSRSKTIEYNGLRKTVRGWSEESGISISNIRNRLGRGWSIKDALFEPVKEAH